ncbi:unnamed protein product [Phyllotreta striolata]|uniref:Uncharacterized protein n=1 Tax=Phyllotreta striolata TaxID=444603 RepID=A0A9N9TEY4_PHYSR|nr:unnamed protein product [Phyllotreta striolata]
MIIATYAGCNFYTFNALIEANMVLIHRLFVLL